MVSPRRITFSLFRMDAAKVDLAVERDTVVVDSRRAALIGLLVNERVMNSLKYAVLPPDFDAQNAEGLGLLLVRSLVQQLDGKFSTESSGSGAEFLLSIPISE